MCPALAELGIGGSCKGRRYDCPPGCAARLVGKALLISGEEGGTSVAGMVPAGTQAFV